MRSHEQELIDELEELLSSGAPGEETPDDLRELLTLASAVREHTDVPRPSPSFRADLRRELIHEIETSQLTLVDRVRDAVWERTAGIRHSAKVALASGLASSMIGSVGVAAAAQQALPGDTLYGVKLWTEATRLSLASGAAQTGQLHLQFASERLEEIQDGVNTELTPSEVIEALEDMDSSSVAGAEDLLRALEAGEARGVLETLREFTAHQRDGLSAVYPHLPTEARPFADDSLEVLRRIDTQTAIADENCECAAGAAARIGEPGSGPVGAVECTCADEVPVARTDDDGQTSDADPSDSLGGVTDSPTPDPTDPTGLPSPTTDAGLIPELPDPLDGVGDSADDALGDLLPEGEADEDPSGTDLPEPDVPAQDSTVTDDLQDAVDSLEDAVDDTATSVDDLLTP